LLGALYFLHLLSSNYSWLENHRAKWQDYGVFSLYFACVIKCLIASSLYHIFNCHSKCTFDRLLKLDYAGTCVYLIPSDVLLISVPAPFLSSASRNKCPYLWVPASCGVLSHSAISFSPSTLYDRSLRIVCCCILNGTFELVGCEYCAASTKF
jgi:predicted membrane channel-forming protein YqfA (hemolysin III family)